MIALLDCNNFYVSCERVFNPSLRGKPVIVLSNNDGCAIARSDEAKELGIKMATPVFMIVDLIKKHNVQVFSSNYELYGDMSDRVMRIIKSFVQVVEVYSIDEIFLDLSNIKYQSIEQLAIDLRQSVQQQTGIPVTVGVAPTKTLAKMANRFAKKFKKKIGVHYAATKEAINEMLTVTEVGDIWGIGHQYEKLLLLHNIKTAFDFVNTNEEWIRKNMSVVGHRMVKEMKGIPCIKWEQTPPPRKAICTSRSFGNLLTKKHQIEEAVAAFTASCAQKLRKENTVANTLQVFVQTNPFRHEDKQYFASQDLHLRVPSNNTKELLSYAMRGLNNIFQNGFNYHKAGILLTDIVPSKFIQLSIFDKPESSQQKNLMKTIDKVNRNFGRDTVRFGSQGFDKQWHLRRQYLSKAFTTNPNEFLTIKI